MMPPTAKPIPATVERSNLLVDGFGALGAGLGAGLGAPFGMGAGSGPGPCLGAGFLSLAGSAMER